MYQYQKQQKKRTEKTRDKYNTICMSLIKQFMHKNTKNECDMGLANCWKPYGEPYSCHLLSCGINLKAIMRIDIVENSQTLGYRLQTIYFPIVYTYFHLFLLITEHPFNPFKRRRGRLCWFSESEFLKGQTN